MTLQVEMSKWQPMGDAVSWPDPAPGSAQRRLGRTAQQALATATPASRHALWIQGRVRSAGAECTRGAFFRILVVERIVEHCRRPRRTVRSPGDPVRGTALFGCHRGPNNGNARYPGHSAKRMGETSAPGGRSLTEAEGCSALNLLAHTSQVCAPIWTSCWSEWSSEKACRRSSVKLEPTKVPLSPEVVSGLINLRSQMRDRG